MKGFGIFVKNNLLEPKHVDKMGGSSLFLYLWLLDRMTSINENGIGKVLGNRPITYEEIYANLGISESTYNRWINRLKSEGYINTVRAPYGLIITVHKAEKIFGTRTVRNDRTLSKRTVKTDGTKRPSSVKSEVREPSIVTDSSVKSDGSNKTIQDNTNNNTIKHSAPKSPEHEQISKLFYEAIKSNNLPTLNHTVIKAKIKQMTTEVEFDKLKEYLLFVRDQYRSIEIEYKPQLNNALDIYSKRVSIENAMRSAIKENTKASKRVLHL